MKLGTAFAAFALVVFGVAGDARAVLSSSEKGQIRDFVARAQAENAGRVRSLVVRTDLAAEETYAALAEALAPVPFTESRAIFLRELVFGVSSASSRPLLAQAVVRALLARADSVFQKYVGGLDHEANAIGELVAIYTFIDGAIANAGRPTLATHDANAGISSAAYEDAAKALRDHIEQNARWLKGDSAVPETVGRVRAEAQIALVDMLPDGLTRRVEAADRLGLTGARRKILIEWGTLFQDAGRLDDANVERVRQLLTRLPGARVDLELLYAGDDRGPLRARGLVARIGTQASDANPFGDEVTPTTVDATASAALQDLAVLAAKRALDTRSDLRREAERDAAASQSDPGRLLGRPRAPSVDHVVASAMHLLLLDAPRATDLALVRVLAGRPESAAILSDAIGALAVFAAARAPDGAATLDVGRDGAASTATMSSIKLAPTGAALAFTLDGHTWSFDRSSPSFAVTNVKRDGQPLALSQLATARTPLNDGSSWSEGSLSFAKLRGTPRVGFAPVDHGPPTVKMAGGGARGYDAISTIAPGVDFVMEGDLTVRGATGGIAIRAVNGREAVRGVMLLVTPGGRMAIVASDDTGGESPLSAAPSSPTAMPVHVKITVKGAQVDAVVGNESLRATFPDSVQRGEIGLVAKRGSSVDLAGLSLQKR